MSLGVLALALLGPGATPEPIQGVDPDHGHHRCHGDHENRENAEDLPPGATVRWDRPAPPLQEGLGEKVGPLSGRRTLDRPPELVDQGVGVEAEVVRVGTEKALGVGRPWEDVPLLVLERLQVFPPDLRLTLDRVDVLAQARTSAAQHLADLEPTFVSDDHRAAYCGRQPSGTVFAPPELSRAGRSRIPRGARWQPPPRSAPSPPHRCRPRRGAPACEAAPPR